jgi:hypothetical protein
MQSNKKRFKYYEREQFESGDYDYTQKFSAVYHQFNSVAKVFTIKYTSRKKIHSH